MQHEGKSISRAEFEANVLAKKNDDAFLSDLLSLITPDTHYNAETALQIVLKKLIALLPGDPWQGSLNM